MISRPPSPPLPPLPPLPPPPAPAGAGTGAAVATTGAGVVTTIVRTAAAILLFDASTSTSIVMNAIAADPPDAARLEPPPTRGLGSDVRDLGTRERRGQGREDRLREGLDLLRVGVEGGGVDAREHDRGRDLDDGLRDRRRGRARRDGRLGRRRGRRLRLHAVDAPLVHVRDVVAVLVGGGRSPVLHRGQGRGDVPGVRNHAVLPRFLAALPPSCIAAKAAEMFPVFVITPFFPVFWPPFPRPASRPRPRRCSRCS